MNYSKLSMDKVANQSPYSSCPSWVKISTDPIETPRKMQEYFKGILLFSAFGFLLSLTNYLEYFITFCFGFISILTLQTFAQHWIVLNSDWSLRPTKRPYRFHLYILGLIIIIVGLFIEDYFI